MITIITYTTTDFEHHVESIKNNCKLYNIPYENFNLGYHSNTSNLTSIYREKIYVMKKALQKYDKILLIDVESKICRELPSTWYKEDLLVSKKYNTGIDNLYPINGGCTLISKKLEYLVDKMLDILDYWSKFEKIKPTDTIICETLINVIALNNLDKMSILNMNYNRFSKGKYDIVRGGWKDEHTIIQHPYQHEWVRGGYSPCTVLINHIDEPRANYISIIKLLMLGNNTDKKYWEKIGAINTTENTFEIGNWTFNPSTKYFAPTEYWASHPIKMSNNDSRYIDEYIASA